MVQLNNVSSASSNTAATSLASSLDPSSLESFESALSDAVSQTLQQFGINPNSVNISIAPASATSTSAAAATSTPATASNSTSTTPAAPDLAGLIPFLGTSSGSAAAPNPAAASSSASTASQAAATPSAETASSENPQQSFDEAYWAQQPAAVQALQSIEDPGQRTEMAQQLATQGYTIDVPIMAWGWDPSAVTSLRQSYGYTWVPSGFQNPIQTAPGINDPGTTPYDPNNPPAGSIAV